MHTPFKQTQDSFSFVKEVQVFQIISWYLLIFVASLENISSNKAIDLAVGIIFNNNESMNATKRQLKELFVFVTS